MDLIKQFRILQHIKNDDKQQLRNKTMEREPEITPEVQLAMDMNCVKNDIDQEGFDYTFTSKSSYGDVENTEFHTLRKDYLEAQRKLECFIEDNADEQYDEIFD